MKALFAAAVAATAIAGAVEACPNWQAAPSFGQISLSAGFLPDPYVRNITAGGRYDLAGCAGLPGAWGGTVASAPDFDLYWSGSSPALTIAVNSGYDTVLLVSAPNGELFWNDDASGLNPGITFYNPQPGLYDIWIGSWNGGRGLPGQLIITER